MKLMVEGVEVHKEDLPHVKPGKHFFAILERRRGLPPTVRLKRLVPLNVRGQPQLSGSLGAFGSGADTVVKEVLGAVVVVSTGSALELHPYGLKEMKSEADLLELQLARTMWSAHVH